MDKTHPTPTLTAADIARMDAQHEEIFSLSDTLENLCLAETPSYLEIGEAMVLLANAWRKHLLEEERLFEDVTGHAQLAHREEHDQIRRALDELQTRFLRTPPEQCRFLGVEMAELTSTLETHLASDRGVVQPLERPAG